MDLTEEVCCIPCNVPNQPKRVTIPQVSTWDFCATDVMMVLPMDPPDWGTENLFLLAKDEPEEGTTTTDDVNIDIPPLPPVVNHSQVLSRVGDIFRRQIRDIPNWHTFCSVAYWQATKQRTMR
jgi:hypothetical protein